MIFAEVIGSCGRDENELAKADEGTRWLLSFYASTPAYRPVLEVSGWQELQPELIALSKSGGWGCSTTRGPRLTGQDQTQSPRLTGPAQEGSSGTL